MRTLLWRGVLALTLLSRPAMAEEDPSLHAPTESIEPGASGVRLPDEIIAKKREGSYLTGVPAIAYSPDSGFIYGAVLFHFNNSTREDLRFSYTPYLYKTTLIAVQSTKGLRQISLNMDLPRFQNSKHRLKPSIFYSRNISEQYFGSNASTMDDLHYPDTLASRVGTNRTDDFSSYEKNLQRKYPDGMTWFRFNQYIHDEMRASFVDEVSVLRPYLSVRAGVTISNIKIMDYSGKQVDAFDDRDKNVRAEMAETRLQQDNQAGLVTGFSGGAVNAMEFGLSIDTRDFEPDPTQGFTTSFNVTSARKELGSDFTFARYTFNNRIFYSPGSAVTLGGQLQHAWSEGDIPFWEMPSAGGRASLKGFRANRFKAKAASWINGEMRFRAHQTATAGQTFVFMPLMFADCGRVYDDVDQFELDSWRCGNGLGLRVIWNQATVIGLEKSLQGEEKSLYVNINHIF